MGEIVVFNGLTLDGVMQAPGGKDEDRRDGFPHGGWAQPYQDEVMGKLAAEGMAAGGDGGPRAGLRLVDSVTTTTTGVIIATYVSDEGGQS